MLIYDAKNNNEVKENINLKTLGEVDGVKKLPKDVTTTITVSKKDGSVELQYVIHINDENDNERKITIDGVVFTITEEIPNIVNNKKIDIFTEDDLSYQNFKKYMQVESYPLHVDYINSDIAPDLIRFMKSKIKKSETDWVCKQRLLKSIKQ